MQDAMENLELNPPAEFFEDAEQPWEIRPLQQRVSALKFPASGYPPLMA